MPVTASRVIARAGMVSGTGRHRSTSDSYAANRGPRYSASYPGDHRWLLRHVNGLNGPASVEPSIVSGHNRDGPDARHARNNRRPGLPALIVLAPDPAHRLPRSLQRTHNPNGANRRTRSILYHAPRRALHPKSRDSHPHPPQGGSHHHWTHHPPGHERPGEVALAHHDDQRCAQHAAPNVRDHKSYTLRLKGLGAHPVLGEPASLGGFARRPHSRRAAWLCRFREVGGTGLEPVTPSLSSWCSPN